MILRRNAMDVFLTVFAGLLCVVLVLLHLNNDLLGIMLGILLVFVLPGQVLSMALFPESTWSFIERIALTIGLSLAMSVLGGILLYALKTPLRAESWAIFYGIIITSAGFWAVYRRQQMRKLPARRSSDTIPIRRGLVMPRSWQIGLFGLAATIIIGSLILVRHFASIYPNTQVVQLWLLPDDSTTPTVRLGAMVNQYAPTEYSVWLQRGGYTVETWHHITLTPGERWEVTIPVDPNMPGIGPLEAYMYQLDQPTIPYRHVSLWLDQLQSK